MPDVVPPSAATIADARALWADASTIDDDVLADILATSWARCVEFLPAGVADDWSNVPGPVMLRWKTANVYDARDLWAAGQRDGDVIAFDTYALRARPMSGTVASLLRPRRGVPMVG